VDVVHVIVSGSTPSYCEASTVIQICVASRHILVDRQPIDSILLHIKPTRPQLSVLLVMADGMTYLVNIYQGND
jgi:hypothetical protein